jgi:hypothetical protein
MSVANLPPSADACGGRSPIFAPLLFAGCKWGKDKFKLDQNKNIHSYFIFSSPCEASPK